MFQLKQVSSLNIKLINLKSQANNLKNGFWRFVSTSSLPQDETLNNKSHSNYKPVIGLEVHAQILSDSKLFSNAGNDYVARPNSQVDYFDLSLPGTLPILNRHCVDVALRTALALNCTIPRQCSFDRKHYFYGDMPNGYQITQQRNPIAKNGWIEFIVFNEYWENRLFYTEKLDFEPYLKRCRLKQIQLEQDSGKSLTDDELGQNLIDLNRAGVPLIEFVFEPDLHSPYEASSLVRELILILKSIDACSCKMQEGALRVDANISVSPKNSPEGYLGTRTEIKNLNSMRFLREGITYEIERQVELLQNDQKIINETMGYNIKLKKTFVMRDKEIVQDYRFMPEPNLPPIFFQDTGSNNEEVRKNNLIDIAAIRKSLPVLPEHIRDKLSLSEYKLSLFNISLLHNDSELRDLFFNVHSESIRKNGDEIVKFFSLTLKPFMVEITTPERKITFCNINEFINVKYLAELIDMQFNEEISESTTIDVLKLYLQKESSSPKTVVSNHNWWLVKDLEEIEKICREVVILLPKIAKSYSKKGIRKPRSMLIQQARIGLSNQVNEDVLWKIFDKILRNK